MQEPNIQAAKNFGANADAGDLGFQYLMSNDDGRAELIANNSALPHEAWRTISDTVIRVREQELTLVNQLRGTPGLEKSLSLANYVDLWHTVSDISGATVSMNPSDQTNEDNPEYALEGAPLPVIHKDWHIDRRMLMASQAGAGPALDSLVPSMMTREVASKFEYLVVNGWGTNVDGYQMYGFNNHPDANSDTTSRDWTVTTGDEDDNIRDSIIAMIESLEDDEYGGPYNLVLHRTQYQALRAAVDNIGNGSLGGNMRSRVNEEFDAELNDIAVSPHVPEGTAFMYQPIPEVVQVGVAEDIQPIEWTSPSGFKLNMKILGAMNVELRSTSDGQMGLVKHTNLGTA